MIHKSKVSKYWFNTKEQRNWFDKGFIAGNKKKANLELIILYSLSRTMLHIWLFCFSITLIIYFGFYY